MQMLEFFWTSFWLWLRQVVKWILHRCTKLCELQRICYGDYKGAHRTLNIEYSLDHSRTLEIQKTMKYLESKCKERTLQQNVIYYATYAIVRVKNIDAKSHKRFPVLLGECLVKIWGYRQLLEEVELLRVQAYNEDNSDHEDKLLKLWAALMPSCSLPSRIGKHWQEIGFQGNDPKTDFRGMGLLGLECLLFFAETHTSAARHVLSRSLHPQFGYSFAIVGINITHLAYTLIVTGRAKSHFYNFSKEFLQINSFFQFFCYLFYEFDVLWQHERPKNIMEFNRVRDKFNKEVRKQLQNPFAFLKCNFVIEGV